MSLTTMSKKRGLTQLLGKKRGMTQLFDDQGNIIVCTVIEVEPSVVTQIKTQEKDGYNAVQMGFEKVKGKSEYTISARVTKPLLGHYKKAGVAPRRHLNELKTDFTEDFTVGQEIALSSFEGVEFVDATAVSKGKGYQGVMKRHNFAGGPASHGSGFHRHAGSTGMRSTPGRSLSGGKKAGQMGNKKTTVQNLRVIKVDAENQLILLKGQVPGPRNGVVRIRQAIKKRAN